MSELTLAGYRQLVDEWINTIGVTYYSELTNTTILMEEVGELARIMARVYGEQSFKRPEDEASAMTDMGDEMADILFVLVCLANQTGIDLEAAVERNIAKKTMRDKERHASNEKLQKRLAETKNSND